MFNRTIDFEDYFNRIVQVFVRCPGILSVFRHGSEEGDTDISCEDYEGKIYVFFVPKQEVIVNSQTLESGLDVDVGQIVEKSYLFMKVSRTNGGDPEFWLVIDPLHRRGYLFPLDVFTEDNSI